MAAEALIGLVMLAILVAMYFLPTIIASNKQKKNATAIGVLNLFFGWTFVGWVGSLVWACMED